MDPWPKIRTGAKCCSCGGSLMNSENMNGVMLNKKATWQHPTWGNVLVAGSGGRASAVVCDQCVKRASETGEWNIKYAIEWDGKYAEFKYHLVDDLEDTYEITEDMIEDG